MVAENERIEKALASNNEDQTNTNLLYGEALEQIDKIQLEVAKMERQRRNSVIGFSICGTGLGVGTGVMTAGFNNENIGMIFGGISVDLISIGSWLLCHYVFELF